MTYRNLRECINDLKETGQLVVVNEEVDPHLEMAEIQRRVFTSGGPAIYFENIKGCKFPAVSNLFGTMERSRFIFRRTLKQVKTLVDLKVDPMSFLKNPIHGLRTPLTAVNLLPWKNRVASVMANQIKISDLPQITSWPKDGGSFITLPQVYSEHADRPGVTMSNLGMYRIQMSGGFYKENEQIGLHYQTHRGIGVHHHAAIQKGEKMKVSIFIGGPPAHTVAAVMPLPEGLTELGFAGALGGRSFKYTRDNGYLISSEADFCITGTVDSNTTLPEGPFGDHLGYHSLEHEMPVLEVDTVYHRDGAIWPFTVVGRPPQEDSSFGELIHEMTGPLIPTVIPGLHSVHAVDAAAVHPLMLTLGSERYTPYEQERKPQEILTIANAILGTGQLSLTKYLFIAAKEDNPDLDINNIEAFLIHLLERVDLANDLHFQTHTNMDTLDYSGQKLNSGSKLVIAAAGEVRRKLPAELPKDLRLPDGFKDPRVALPGVCLIAAPLFSDYEKARKDQQSFCAFFEEAKTLDEFPLVILVDDAEFAARTLNNFLWTTFTRSDPATDIRGVREFIENKHWGCRGSLVIDARLKPHYPPELVEDPNITKRVDELSSKGKSLHGVI